ncbi:MAG: alpha/beta hydrolase, partial [Actinomycetales bacterium]|nr:alpha/beta hydrolase [Actinomycetales bacterium]
MTRDLPWTRPATASPDRFRPRPYRPDLARWPEVAMYGAAGAAAMFALSGGLLTVGARVMARLPLVPRESLRGRPDVTVRAVHPG